VTDWLIVNPKDLDRNTDESLYPDANANYSLWGYEITDTNGDPSPRVQLAPSDTELINLDIMLNAQVPAENHTIYLRIREDISDPTVARYFDLPLTILIGKDKPQLSIHQKSQIPPLQPLDTIEIQMKVKNEGNSDVLVLLDAKTTGVLDVEVTTLDYGNVVNVPAFTEVDFTVTVTVGEAAQNGDTIRVEISAKPLSQEESFGEQYTAKKNLDVQISINDVIGIIVSEISNPRPATIAIGIGMIILIVAAVSGRRNRVEYIDVWVDDEDLESEGEIDLPDLVSAEDDDIYDEDDIELVDLD